MDDRSWMMTSFLTVGFLFGLVFTAIFFVHPKDETITRLTAERDSLKAKLAIANEFYENIKVIVDDPYHIAFSADSLDSFVYRFWDWGKYRYWPDTLKTKPMKRKE